MEVKKIIKLMIDSLNDYQKTLEQSKELGDYNIAQRQNIKFKIKKVKKAIKEGEQLM